MIIWGFKGHHGTLWGSVLFGDDIMKIQLRMWNNNVHTHEYIMTQNATSNLNETYNSNKNKFKNRSSQHG